MEEMKNMEWRKKLELLKLEIDNLKEQRDLLNKKSLNLTGCELSKIEACANQDPIRECMENTRTKYLKAHSVHTQGAPCIILSSTLYPEFGFLIFDGPEIGEGVPIGIKRDPAEFRLVCGCCRPYAAGVGKNELSEDLRRSFILAVRKTCKEHGIKYLCFGCNNHDDLNMESDYDGLLTLYHLVPDSMQMIDKWRFAVAFSEINIGDATFPFENFFTKQKS
jgi:hypothetical protein